MPATMKATVKKTISLPRELAREVEETARSEGKTISAVIEDALRKNGAASLWREFKVSQNYWSRIAKDKGILTEADLRRYLAK
jgi:predicted transcriptional regulator